MKTNIIQNIMTPEECILTASARTEPDNEAAELIEITLERNPDWNRIIKLSEHLGVQPLLYKHLSEKYSSQVPDDIMKQLRENFHRQGIRSLRHYALIQQIADAMNQADIPVVLLKGAFLAKWIYRDIALRPMNDIDILCRREDSRKIHERMNKLGYYQQKIAAQSPLHEKLITSRLMADRFPPFINDKGNKVDIHFDIFQESGISSRQPTASVWNRIIPCFLNGSPVYSLSPEDLLLHLSLHLHKHLSPYFGVTMLYWFCDIHEVIRYYNEKINWEQFLENAEKLESGSKIASVLHLLKENWRTPVPDYVLQQIGRESRNFSLLRILRKEEDYHYHYREIFKTVSEITGWKERLSFLLRFVFPTKEYLISRYQPKNLSFVYFLYILHPFRLFIRAFQRFFPLLKKGGSHDRVTGKDL